MAPRARRALLASLLALLLCAACGWPEMRSAPESVDDGAHWHARPDGHHQPWGLSRRESVRIALPEAENASEDRDSGPLGRLVLNLLPSGSLAFKGNVWPLETGVEEERRAALAALRDELVRRLADPTPRAEIGSSLVPVMIHADRAVSWETVRSLLPVLSHPDVLVNHLQLAVFQPHRTFAAARRGQDHRIDGALSPIGGTTVEAAPLSVQLTATSTGTGAETRIAVADRTWSFGDQDAGFEDPDFLRQANAVWEEVAARLPVAAQGTTSAQVVIEDEDADLWFAYVVKTVDLLLGVGIRDVSFPDADLRVVFAEPEVLPDAALEDDPVVTPAVLAGCALAVLLAFAITFLPRTRTRRRT